MTAEDVLAMGFEHIAIATGAARRRDAVARPRLAPMLHDDDHFDMGSAIAEALPFRRELADLLP